MKQLFANPLEERIAQHEEKATAAARAAERAKHWDALKSAREAARGSTTR